MRACLWYCVLAETQYRRKHLERHSFSSVKAWPPWFLQERSHSAFPQTAILSGVIYTHPPQTPRVHFTIQSPSLKFCDVSSRQLQAPSLCQSEPSAASPRQRWQMFKEGLKPGRWWETCRKRRLRTSPLWQHVCSSQLVIGRNFSKIH